jgi:hypothetical protein
VDPDHAPSELTYSVATDSAVECLSFAAVPRNRLGCESVPAGLDAAWVTVTMADPLTIASPSPGATVTELTGIVGSIVDPDGDLVRYTITVSPLDSAAPARTVTVAAEPGQVLEDRVDTHLGWLDATLLTNGTYRVEVLATDLEERVGGDSRIVEVQGNLKLGNFTLTFVDLDLPTSGIPITITRTYDTLQAHRQGDFGYGWRMDLTNAQVEVIQPGHDLPEPRPFIDGDRIVFTLPDGSTHGFTFYAAYRVQGELLSTIQDSRRSVIGLLMPDGNGTNYWLPASAFDPLARHYMTDVIDGFDLMLGGIP